MSAHDVAHFLKKKADESGLTHTEITRRAAVSRQTWYKLLNGEVQEAKFSTLVRISRTLRTHPMELIGLYFGSRAVYVPNLPASEAGTYKAHTPALRETA